MKKLLPLFFIFIFLGAGCLKQQNTQDTPASNKNNTASPASGENIQNAGAPIYNGRPIFAGTLAVSNDLSKGNLMLLAKPDNRMPGDITKDTTLYIKTQRDYSKLINKKVLVAFTGDPNNHIQSFQLIDMVEDTGQTSF